jgi:uncharacterized membrane protein
MQHYESDELLRMTSGQVLSALACKTGYLRRIDYDALTALADSHEGLFEIKMKAGDFIFVGEILMMAFFPNRLDYRRAESLRTFAVCPPELENPTHGFACSSG